MNALSIDLRKRILNYALLHPVRPTAELFQVSPDTVHRLKQLYYATGDVAPRPARAVHAHSVSPQGELYLQLLLSEAVDLTLGELCDRYEQAYGVRVGVSTMHGTLKRMGYSRKKTLYDPHRDDEEKASYIGQLEGVEVEDRVYLDEMGCPRT
jgi:transposase